MSPLARATLVLIAFAIGHDLDHAFNQPSRDYAAEITALALLSYPALFGTLYLAVRRNPLAPLAATFMGFSVLIGFALVHLAPHWSVLSDPYGKVDVNWLSWMLVAGPMAAGLTLALFGLRTLRSKPAVPATA